MEKSRIFDQNHGLTRLEKITIFRLFKILLFMANFEQNHGLTPLEIALKGL